jgi:esterase/lipase superfamily enzyme
MLQSAFPDLPAVDKFPLWCDGARQLPPLQEAVVMGMDSTVSRVLIMGLLLLAGAAGCRRPPAIIVKKRRPSVYYDTRYEKLLEKEKRPLIQEAFASFVEVLDEPVAVIQAEGQATTWEVFFATNRGLDQTTAGSDQVRFRNELVRTPYVGRAEIMIPHRRRGYDPARQPPTAAKPVDATAVTKTSEADPFQFVKFDEVRDSSWAEMSAGVNRQIAASRQKDLLLFVHGFNVDFESALIRTAQVALDMPFNGAVVCYSWPSQGGVTNYANDANKNAESVEPFAMFLQQLLADVPPETRVNIVVHSMGNRLVLQGIAGLPSPAKSKPIATLALCAPDVGISDFQKLAPAVVKQCERVALYASTGDSALIISKRVNQEQRAGDSHPPLVVAGIETIDVSAVDFDFMGHSYYGGNVDVLADLFRLIKERRGPETCAYLTRHNAGYWYFSDFGDVLGWEWHFDETLRR